MDNVNKPNHYMLDGIPGVEVKDVIKAVLGEDTVILLNKAILRRLEMKKNPVTIAEQLDFFDDIYEECASCSRKNCRNYKMNSKADTVFITRNVPNCKICKKNEKK